jgi:hypothetical protein
MYFSNYARPTSAYGDGENNSHDDLVLWGPDLAVRWYLRDFFAQVSSGVRISDDKWFGSGISDHFKYYDVFYSLSFAIGYSF